MSAEVIPFPLNKTLRLVKPVELQPLALVAAPIIYPSAADVWPADELARIRRIQAGEEDGQ